MTKMNWDRVNIENHIYRESRGSHIRALADEQRRTRGRRQSEPQGHNLTYSLDRWPKVKKKAWKKTGTQCPDCGKWVVGMKDHRRDKHGVSV
jgi:hypothetical protein